MHVTICQENRQIPFPPGHEDRFVPPCVDKCLGLYDAEELPMSLLTAPEELRRTPSSAL